MLDLIQPLLHFIHNHPHWAAFFTFFIAFIESLAILGLFIPGSTILGLIGGLIGAHILSPTAIIIAAILGAIAGDGLSYWLGYRYHDAIRGVWPFNRFTSLLEKGEKFFVKHGGKSIFLARFFGPLRPIMPLIAGILRLNPTRFLIANVLSALLWAPGYILLGVVVGHQIALAHPHHLFKLFTEIIIGFMVFWLLYYLVRGRIIKLIILINHKIKWRHNKMESSFWKNLLRDIPMPTEHRQLSTAILATSMLVLFLILMSLLLVHVQFVTINQSIYHGLQSLSAPFPLFLMQGISLLGDTKILFPLAAIIFLYLFLKKQKSLAFHWLGLIIVMRLSLSFFKELVHSPRPEIGAMTYMDHSVYSFPSGHVGMAIAFWGFLAFIVSQNSASAQFKKDILALAVFIILIVMFSRLFLGMHWLTDVIGSLFLGIAYLNFAILSYRRGASK
jgi:membrane protein DedA with SNARE-associated domain/membrane-associated phospholipid phosphatase